MTNTDRKIIKEYDLEMGRIHGAIMPYMNRETLITSIEILKKFLLMPDDVKLEMAKKYFNDPEPF